MAGTVVKAGEFSEKVQFMSKFFPLQVAEVKRETSDCVSIAFHIPQENKAHFNYIQGQYITLKLKINGEELRRSYSICSSPQNGELMRIAVKQVPSGKASTWINSQLKAGDVLEAMPPEGKFYTTMPSGKVKHYVAVAAGSGITPVLSLLKTALLTEPQSTFTLFYGNRSINGIIFKDELGELSARYPERLRVYHILSRDKVNEPFFNGRIDAAKCQEIVDGFPAVLHANEYFLCGPFEMIQTITRELRAHGVDKSKIHFELFTTEDASGDLLGNEDRTDENLSAVTSRVTVILDAEETVVEVNPGQSILDAVLDAGLDAPYACTGGSCCTCRAKSSGGKAFMDVNYALTEKEVEDGYLLTCQAHPTTPALTVDYDAP